MHVCGHFVLSGRKFVQKAPGDFRDLKIHFLLCLARKCLIIYLARLHVAADTHIKTEGIDALCRSEVYARSPDRLHLQDQDIRRCDDVPPWSKAYRNTITL